MNTQNLTVAVGGGLLMGAGIQTVSTQFEHGLILIGIGVFMQVVVAVLQKYGVPISGAQPR